MSRKTKIFVGALAEGVTNDDLRALFEQIGPVAECDVLGQYGFVHMIKPADAEKAIQELHNTTLKGQRIRVLPSNSNRPPKTKLFVGSLPDATKEEELRELFEKHGKVTEVAVMGVYGFVHMEKVEEAQKAIEELNGSDFKGSTIRVESSTGEKRNEQSFRSPRGRGGFFGPRMHPYGARPPMPPPYHMRREPPYMPPRTRMPDMYGERPSFMPRRPQDVYPPPPTDLYQRRPPYEPRPDDLYSRRPDSYAPPLPPSRPDDIYSRRPDYYPPQRPDDLYERRAPIEYPRRGLYQNGINGRPY